MTHEIDLPHLAGQVLDTARKAGADSAELMISASRGYSLNVRQQAVESLEFQQDRELSLTVYVGLRKGVASTGDLTEAGLRDAVTAAVDIARATGEDPCHGLAEASLMATHFPDLDLDHPWDIAPADAVLLAQEAERAALAVDARIRQSEGAGFSSHRSHSLYANSHGFLGARTGTSHGYNCAVVAADGDDMQRDDWYTYHRRADQLESPESVGREAGRRAVRRLGARRIRTQAAPVLFVPELARGLIGSFIGAISGGALYRRASFLLDAMDQPIFPAGVSVHQRPYLPCAAASSAFDGEGVATRDRTLIDDGVLRGWVLGSYSARRLGLTTTGNAGGLFNLLLEAPREPFDHLLKRMGRGLLVTELMGSGVNGVTGDYSRGAAGFWVENGEIAHPVDELTIAGNLRDLYKNFIGFGDDIRPYATLQTGSVLVSEMMIAAQDAADA
ncbi:MAG: metalloprotease PmbA [Polycyclovorans sp.]|jgi:PmbA protein|nr:metalloprotease PmbA [Polycyclovorans sp.]MDP1544129.1 metalloprotease PmbA [Polycyclovorans sp.]|tara:strand:+ start:595 stop:1932 length:1338 start_codon:yes stop_codon:yes gene_type:complete